VPGSLIFIAIPLTLWFLLGRTSWMQNLYATGGDDVAAYAAGVPVNQVRLLAYALGGAFAGLGGIALTAVLRSADASIASQYILIAVTAVALGGTSLAGGRGGLAGSLIGATIIYLIQNAATTLQVPSPWLNVVYGSVLLVAIILAGGLPMRARAAA
jgi:ribose transport system permease protein